MTKVCALCAPKEESLINKMRQQLNLNPRLLASQKTLNSIPISHCHCYWHWQTPFASSSSSSTRFLERKKWARLLVTLMYLT